MVSPRAMDSKWLRKAIKMSTYFDKKGKMAHANGRRFLFCINPDVPASKSVFLQIISNFKLKSVNICSRYGNSNFAHYTVLLFINALFGLNWKITSSPATAIVFVSLGKILYLNLLRWPERILDLSFGEYYDLSEDLSARSA